MKDFPQRQLLVNYLLELCTPSERQEVECWLDKEPDNVSLLQEIARDMGHEGTLSPAEKSKLRHRVLNNIEDKKTASPVEKRKREAAVPRATSLASVYRWSGIWLKVAAVILIVSTAGLIGFYYGSSDPLKGAEEIKFQQRSLSNGQTAVLRFGDGSVITLNAGSTLRYPKKFSENKREVYLRGEAFFSITPDSARPFIVHAANTKTRVLGTSFNIRAYENEEDLQVTVVDGKVAVSQSGNGQGGGLPETVLLNEKQWVTYSSAGPFVEQGEGDIEDLIAWKDRKLVFSDQSFEQVTKRLERWYNLNIVLADSALKTRRLSASFEKETMREVLAIITMSLDVSYQKKGKTITFYARRL